MLIQKIARKLFVNYCFVLTVVFDHGEVRTIKANYGDDPMLALSQLLAQFPGHHTFVDELVMSSLPSMTSSLATLVQARLQQSSTSCLWLVVAGKLGSALTQQELEYVFPPSTWLHPHLSFPLRGTAAITREGAGANNGSAVTVAGCKSVLKLTIPDQLMEGVEVVKIKSKTVEEGVEEAMRVLTREEGEEGVAVLCEYNSGIADVVRGVEMAGRAKPLVYTEYQQCSEAEVTAWFSDRGRDLVADDDTSRGWEAPVVVTVRHKGEMGAENLALRAVSRLLIVTHGY